MVSLRGGNWRVFQSLNIWNFCHSNEAQMERKVASLIMLFVNARSLRPQYARVLLLSVLMYGRGKEISRTRVVQMVTSDLLCMR